MTVLEKMLKKVNEAGFYATSNTQKIANAKKIMFSEDEWYRCPCDAKNSLRSCISDLCRSDIETKGICHCRCYSKTPEEQK